MKLLFVVQRYGLEVLGGSEAVTRQYAIQLAARGHDVHVLTSCAVSYDSWANSYPAGDHELDGVIVHRLPVSRPRDGTVFGALHWRLFRRPTSIPLYLHKEWMRLLGPLLPDLERWLLERSGDFDVVIFMTYLFYTTWAGLAAVRVPSLLIPTAHDEPPFWLPLFDGVFRLPHAFGFLTEEEAALTVRRFGIQQPWRIIGAGVEPMPGDPAAFRTRFGLGERPYLAYAGRIDPAKGAAELFQFFRVYKERRPGPLALVMIGQDLINLPDHPDVIKTGFVDERTKDTGISAAQLLVQPSYFESFSLVLAEALALGVPAIVQSRCDVLLGQARRSGGAVPYHGYREFEAALDLLLENEALRRRLAASGRAWVRERYTWDSVLDRLGELITCARAEALSCPA